MKKYVFSVDGMMCGMCEAHVNDAVRKAANVQKVTSSHKSGKTEIIGDDINVEAIKTAIEEEGYKVSAVTEEDKPDGLLSKLFKKK